MTDNLETMTVRERLLALQSTFSPSEQRIAERLIDGYPTSGLGSLHRIAEESDVSAPTVLRLVVKLGFSGYPAFRDQLHTEVADMLNSRPVPGVSESTTVMSKAVEVFSAQIAETLREEEFVNLDQAAELLADLNNFVLVTGGPFSGLVGDHIAVNLSVVRPNVWNVSNDPRERTVAAMNADSRTVLLATNFKPLDPATLQFSRDVVKQGGTLIALTDTTLSPFAADASIVLRASQKGMRASPSMVGATMLAELLIGLTSDKLAPEGRQRLRDYLDRETHSYAAWRRD